MYRLLCFVLCSIPLVVISRKSILNPGSHGFYRFLAWEGMLWMFIANARFWFDDPFSFRQIVSWVLLLISLYLLIASVIQFRRLARHIIPGMTRSCCRLKKQPNWLKRDLSIYPPSDVQFAAFPGLGYISQTPFSRTFRSRTFNDLDAVGNCPGR